MILGILTSSTSTSCKVGVSASYALLAAAEQTAEHNDIRSRRAAHHRQRHDRVGRFFFRSSRPSAIYGGTTLYIHS